MSCIIITPSTKAVYDDWYSRALKDDGVWPFMSFDKRIAPSVIEGDDWNELLLIDESRTALLRWSNNRSNGLWDASVSLWALSGPTMHLTAGRLAGLLPDLARRYGVKYVGAACHASNANCCKILTKRFGKPWGRQPASAWNGKLGCFEDSLHFRISVERWAS